MAWGGWSLGEEGPWLGEVGHGWLGAVLEEGMVGREEGGCPQGGN